MPSVSGSPSQLVSSVATVLELESIITINFKRGDFAFVAATNLIYQLDPTSTLPRNGTTILYTRESNAAYFSVPGPGRWIQLGGGTLPFGPSQYVERNSKVNLVFPSPAPGALLTAPGALTAPANGVFDIDLSWSASNITAESSVVTARVFLEVSINGGAFVAAGTGGSSAQISPLSNQGGKFTTQVAVLAAQTALFRASGVCSAASGAAINAWSGTQDTHLHFRTRFYAT